MDRRRSGIVAGSDADADAVENSRSSASSLSGTRTHGVASSAPSSSAQASTPPLDNLSDSDSSSDSDDSDADSDDASGHRSLPSRTTAVLASSPRRLAIAYAGLLLVAFTTSLEAQVTAPLAAFAVSSFQNHSLLSTVYVVQGVVNAVIKPPMAKMADVFGRFEAFVGAVLLCVAGYVQMACAPNVQTFAAAQILYSSGITGLQVLQQILVADTTDLRHRALLSSLPDTPFLVTVWIGPSIAAALLAATSWRLGYGMWAVLLPLAFLPLGGSLAVSAYEASRAKKPRLLLDGSGGGGGGGGDVPASDGDDDDPASPIQADVDSRCGGAAASRKPSSGRRRRRRRHRYSVRRLFRDLDIVGIVLLSAALALVLLPLTLANKVAGGWHNPTLGASVGAGLVLLVGVFPAWEARPQWAPHPLIPPVLLRSGTFCAGCGVAFFFFAVFYLSVQPYFYSYLLVAHNQPVAAAGRITQIFSFVSTIAAVSASVAIRHLRRYKVFVVSGACVYLAGVGLMLLLRTAGAGTARLVATQVAVGLGAGLMSVPTQIGVQAACADAALLRRPGDGDGGRGRHRLSGPRLVAAATAVYLTMGEAGIAVGAALSGGVWGHLVPAKLAAYLPEPARQNASAIYASVDVARSYPWGSPERVAIARAYQEAMTALLTVALAFCVPVLLLALLMHDYRFGREGRDGPADEPAPSPLAFTVNDFTGTAAVGERTILLSSTEADEADE